MCFVYRTARWGERNKPIERMEEHLGYATKRARVDHSIFFFFFLVFQGRRLAVTTDDAIKNGRVSRSPRKKKGERERENLSKPGR